MAKLRIPQKVTMEWLQRHWACPDQTRLFEQIFPEGMEVTMKNLRRAAKNGLSVGWFGQQIGLIEHENGDCPVCNNRLALKALKAVIEPLPAPPGEEHG